VLQRTPPPVVDQAVMREVCIIHLARTIEPLKQTMLWKEIFGSDQANLGLVQLSATVLPAAPTTVRSQLKTPPAPPVPTVAVAVEDKAVEDVVAHAVMTATLALS
jgi:hypothetical protein